MCFFILYTCKHEIKKGIVDLCYTTESNNGKIKNDRQLQKLETLPL